MNQSNAYWEQAESKYWSDLDEELLVKKISNCEDVVSNLEKSPVWKVIVEDVEEKRRYLDDNWQDVSDEKILNNMRIKKSAVKYILNLKKNYQKELERAKVELKRRVNTNKEVLKDYDTE